MIMSLSVITDTSAPNGAKVVNLPPNWAGSLDGEVGPIGPTFRMSPQVRGDSAQGEAVGKTKTRWERSTTTRVNPSWGEGRRPS